MTKYILFIALVIWNYSIAAQDKLTNNQRKEKCFEQGVACFENKDFVAANAYFVDAKQSNPKRTDIYYYLAASSYYANLPKETTYKYINMGIWEKDYRTLLFYSVEFSGYKASTNEKVFLLVDSTKEGWAFLSFCKANLLAKKKQQNAFIYLNESLKGGFKIPSNAYNNPLRKLNEERYIEILSSYSIPAYNESIKAYTELKILQWQKKRKFEKTADYTERVTEINRAIKVKEFVQDYIDSVGCSQYGFGDVDNKYDADNEVYKLTFQNDKYIFLGVPIREAPSFDANFSSVRYENATFTLTNNSFDLLHLEVVDNISEKTYIFDSGDVLAFNTDELELQFSEIILEEYSFGKENINSTKPKQVVDVDINIPTKDARNGNKFALIIGNEDYTNYQTGLTVEQNVLFAKQDAAIFREYCIKTLEIPNENIIFKTNAGVVQMRQGLNQMNAIIKNTQGEAEVIVYYAGHGFPDKNNESILIPVDVSSSSLEMGISLNGFINKLTEYPSKSVVLFVDACFTGGGREEGLLVSRGVKIVPRTTNVTGNIVLFSASKSNQSALAYDDKGHGLFTYYLLKKLQESNGNVTLNELDRYLKREVSIKSTLLYSIEQNPEIYFSPEVAEGWKSWDL